MGAQDAGDLSPELIQRFRRGDADAFLDVYQRFAKDVRDVVARCFSSAFEREEAIQEVWLTTHRMRNLYSEERGTLRPWLRALAFNRCKELLRSKGRRIQPELEVGEDVPVDSPTPDLSLQQTRVREAVSRFVQSLAPDERAALTQGLLEERTHEELAQVLSLTVRQSKYLRKKLLARAMDDPDLQRALSELL